ERGNLVLHLSRGDLQFQKPYVYQLKESRKIEIEGSYAIAGNTVRFNVGAYDRTRELIIDPVLNYSSYLGGAGGSSAVAIKLDASGNAYVTGSAANLSFPPTATNSCSGCVSGTSGVYVASISGGGDAINYLAVVGGAGTDVATSIAVDASGEAHVGGN